MLLVVLAVGAFWYLKWRKRGRGNREISEFGDGEQVPPVLNTVKTALPYYVSPLYFFVPFIWVANLHRARSFRTPMIRRLIHLRWTMGNTHRLMQTPSLLFAEPTDRVCSLMFRSRY